jgi:hypothetical protein
MMDPLTYDLQMRALWAIPGLLRIADFNDLAQFARFHNHAADLEMVRICQLLQPNLPQRPQDAET